MNRTLIRDVEISNEYLFKEGYGTNNTNLLLDGYVMIKDNGVPAAAPSGHLVLYYAGGQFSTINSGGTSTSIGGATSGTFTPSFNLGGVSQSTSYALGSYSKTGNAVTVVMSIAFTKSSTGALTIEALPFATLNTTNLRQGLVVSKYNGFTSPTIYGRITSIQATMDPNSTTIKIQRSVGDAGTDLQDTNLASTGTIEITGTYLSN